MSSRRLTRCGLCDSTNLELVLDLGSSPPTCVMPLVGPRQPAEDHHPLEVLSCQDCGLAQLSVVVDPEVVFPSNYPYSSGHSQALHDDFADLAADAGSRVHGLLPDDVIVDIGANDGTLLSKFPAGVKIGVEPTGQVQRIDGIAYQAFFDESLARRILDEHGPARVITACNVLAHVGDIHGVMRGIGLLLADDGILIAENHDLGALVDGGQWDTVYHEHLRFYSPHTFAALLDRHGLAVRACQEIPTHGGSFRIVAEKGQAGLELPVEHHDFGRLAQAAAEARAAIRDAAGPGVWGIGATARATTIINYCGLDVEDLECVCEVHGSDKIGHFVPGTRIPVVDERELFQAEPDVAILFSWHLAKSIVPKLRGRGFDGQIVVPLPVLTCL